MTTKTIVEETTQVKPKSSSIFQLGLQAQELETAIGHIAARLESDDEEERASAVRALEESLLMEELNNEALMAKADATCWVIDRIRGQAAFRKQQAQRLAELAKADQSRADSLEESLVLVLTRLRPASTRFSFDHHELTSRRSAAVEIEDESALGEEWVTVTTTTKPDKLAIKQALQGGTEVPGAKLVQRRSWSIK